MTRILFICHGNICRSPMAEFVMRDLAEKNHCADEFKIDSAAVSSEELGNPVYPPARRLLNAHGIDCSGKYARRMQSREYDEFDLIIAMDNSNLRNLARIVGGDPENKIHLLMEYAGEAREVADPWYTGEFDPTWRDINAGCRGLFTALTGREV